jgi:hypothetical protein
MSIGWRQDVGGVQRDLAQASWSGAFGCGTISWRAAERAG